MPQLSLDDLELVAQGQPVPMRETPTTSPARQRWTQDQVRQQVWDEAKRQGVDPALAVNLTWQESRFREGAKSPAGAIGPMQLMPGTAKDLDVDPYDVAQNIRGGMTYLKQQLARFGGDQRKALAAYNAGPGAVQKYGDVPPYKETQGYVSTILGRMGRVLSPASAEAAPAQRLSLEELEQRFGGRGAGSTPTPTTTPQPPTARATPEQDAAYRASVGQGTPPPGPPAPEPSSGSGVATPAPAPPPLATLAMGQGPAAQPVTPQPVTDPAARLATAGSERPTADLATLPAWGKAALATGMSTGLGVGGAALGTAILPGAGTVAGELGGSALARWLNVKLGLEAPGIVGDVASVAVPGLLRGAGALYRGVVPRLPGAGAVRHEMAQEAIEGLERRLAPQVTSDVLWQQASRQGNPAVATLETWRTASDILRTARTAPTTTAAAPWRTLAEDFHALSRRFGGPVPIEELDRFRRTLQPHLRDPQVQRLYGAVLDDMEHAASRGVTGAGVMREAIATTRYEHSLDELASLWSPGVGIKTIDGNTTQVLGKSILDNFDKRMAQNPVLRGAFSQAELTDIRATLQTVARLSAISPAAGGGLSGQIGRGATTVAGSAAGGIPGMVAGFVAPEVLAAAMRTPIGRAAIRQALAEGNGRLTAAGYAMINEAVRQGLEATTTGHPPPGLSGESWAAPGGPARQTD